MKIDLDNYEGPLTPVSDFPHWLDLDLEVVVALNHRLTLERISKLQERAVASVEASFSYDPDVLQSAIWSEERHYADLRTAANNLAMVGIVTRLQQWIESLVKRHEIKVAPSSDGRLIKLLRALNKDFGEGSVSIDFFDGLVNARDSVIHGDSSAKWSFNGKERRIPDCYSSPGDTLEITPDQVKEAISKAVEQVTWYDERIALIKSKA